MKILAISIDLWFIATVAAVAIEPPPGPIELPIKVFVLGFVGILAVCLTGMTVTAFTKRAPDEND